MSELSPAARAVWEAAMNTPDHMPYEYDIAAALRAAAVEVVIPKYQYANWEMVDLIMQELLTIAKELENQ